MQRHSTFAPGPFRDVALGLANAYLFWARVAPVSDDPDACWEWTGARDAVNGYGKWRPLYVRGAQVYAHRVAYFLAYGEYRIGLKVCHRCDNPPCCRPDHLFVGTQKENLQDMLAKGRGRWQRAHVSSATPLPSGSGSPGASA
jgi:hypothetical protein